MDGDPGVDFRGNGAQINNSGIISAKDGEAGIDGSASGTGVNLLITNNTTGQILSFGEAPILFNGTGSGTLTIDNSGRIMGKLDEDGFGGRAIDLHDIKGSSAAAQMNIIINNRAGALITTEANEDLIRFGKENVVATLNNWGTIISAVGAADSDAVDIQDKLARATVNNYATGIIEGGKHGIGGDQPLFVYNWGQITGNVGSGINVDDALEVTVENHGTITGGKTLGGDGDAIDVDHTLHLVNDGRIQGLNGRSAEGLAIGGGDIKNLAGGVIFGEGRGILVDDSNEGPTTIATTIYNEGVIQGAIYDGIRLIGNMNDTIINKGTIIGGENGLAIHMGGGNDTLTIYTGSKIEGLADGGQGTNTLNLEGVGTDTLHDNIYNFSRISVNSGTWTSEIGSADFTVNQNGTLIIDQQHAYQGAFGGNISANYGRVDLNGTFEGGVHIYAGTLAIAGSEIGSLTVETASSRPLTLEDDFLGDHTVKSSTLEITVNAAGKSDLLTVITTGGFPSYGLDLYSGIDPTYGAYGTTLKVEALAGNYAKETTYHIVHVNGEIFGEGFREVLTNFAFLDASLEYETSDIFLTLARNDTQFWDVAKTANQSGVAHAIAGAPGSDLHNKIVTMGVGEAQGSFDSLSGESYASSMSTQIVQANLVNDTIQGHAGSVFGTVGGTAQPPAFAPPQYLGAREEKRDQQPEMRGAAAQSAGWAKGFGQWLSMDGDGNAAGIDSTVGGVVAGYDAVSKNAVFGFAAGYVQASADVDSRASSADTDTFLVATYGAVRIDRNLTLSGGASYGWSWSDSERRVLGDKLTASYDGNTGSVFGELAYLQRMGRAALEPFAGVSYIEVDQDGFTETGGVGALTSDGQSFDSVSSTVGLRVAYDSIGTDGTRITPRASLAWRHAFGDVTPDAALRFADTGTGFAVAGVPIAEDSLVVGAGIEFGLARNVTIGFDYSGAFAEDSTSNAGKAVGRVEF